jgi:hypothetical protein
MGSGWTRCSPRADDAADERPKKHTLGSIAAERAAGGAAAPKALAQLRPHGPLPRSTTRAPEVAIDNLPVRTPWPGIDEEAWWCDVLADRRLRRSSAKALSEKDENAGQRLDRLPVKSLTFSCAWCGQRTVIKVAELIRMFGRDRNDMCSSAATGARAAKAKSARSRTLLNATVRPRTPGRVAPCQPLQDQLRLYR